MREPHKRPASALRARATCLESSDARSSASKEEEEEEEEERGAGEARAERGRASVTTAASTRAVEGEERPSEHRSVNVSSFFRLCLYLLSSSLPSLSASLVSVSTLSLPRLYILSSLSALNLLMHAA